MRRAVLHNACTKGVIDPQLDQRIDLEHYYNSLHSGLNISCKPQGGFRRRAGTTLAEPGRVPQRTRRRLQPLALTADMVTAPNGGTIANLVDQSETTRFATNAVSGATFVLASVDLGVAREVCFVDVLDYACAAGRFARSIAVEYNDGTSWVAFAPDAQRARKGISSGLLTETLRRENVSSKGVDAQTVKFSAPFDGRITKIKTRLDTAMTGSNATVTLKIDDIAVTGGLVTIVQNGSQPGDIDEAFPTALNTFVADQVISATVGGGNTATGTLDIEIEIEEVQTHRSRRFGLAPGGTRSARLWRVVAYDAVGAGAIGIGGLRFWQEKRQLSPQNGFSFARASDKVYEIAITDRNVDVFQGQRWLAALPVETGAQQVEETSSTQSLDTALLYHEDVQTIRVTRQGDDDEWNGQPARFYNVPKLTLGTAFAGEQDEVQEVRLPGIVTGDNIVLWCGRAVTAALTWGSATIAADIVAALVAIGVPSGVAVEMLAAEPGFRVTFTAGAGGRRWPMLQAVVLDVDDVEAATTIVQKGLDIDGPVFGETTGWPRHGVVYQERHIAVGFRAAPLSFGVSRYDDGYDFDDDGDPLTADLGFFGTLNSDQLETIHAISIARHILFLTESGVWFADARTIDATQPFNVQAGPRYGFSPNLPVVQADGSPVYVQTGGRVVRDLVYSDVDLTYSAEPLTLLAPHLLTSVVDVGYRNQRGTDEGNELLMVNADGTIAAMSLLKSQKVIAAAPWSTDGRFTRAFGDVQQRMWTIVRRETPMHGPDYYLERFDETHTLDAAVKYDNGGAASDLVTGLAVHEGKQVWAWADGDLVGPLLCEDGEVRLPLPATEIVVGLFPAARARLPELREKLQNGYPWRPPARIYEVEVAVEDTGDLDISVNGGPFRPVPLTTEAGLSSDIGSYAPRLSSDHRETAPGDTLESLIRGVSLIPATGEFAYGTTVVTKSPTGGGSVLENRHGTTADSDCATALGQALRAMSRLGRVSLHVAWFGDDLRAGECQVQPKVDTLASAGSWAPYDWSVATLTRGTASQVTLDGLGRPLSGGTPDDRSVREAIAEAKRLGLAVTLSPIILLDIASGNSLPNPYGGASQPALPWRGRITCHPAPGQAGTADLTAAAATQIAAFVGTVTPAHFSVSGSTVTYSGPAEWTYRRMILHYAALAKAAGGVETFVIGSELRGLTWARSALGVYPFVTALAGIAADVKAILGSETKVTYAADWSELAPHQTGVSGELFFHLDPLWLSASIDAVGVDVYWPLADWRSGTDHLDYIAGRSIYDRAYLQSNIEGGEAYDWYYASGADRDDQVRTPITDGAYGKPWVWRAKDIRSWWLNAHKNRPGGVESASGTGWLPGLKPIWIMEVGCAALDRAANQPAAIYDPASGDSTLPHYSRGHRDDLMQRAYLEALIGWFTPGAVGFDEAHNPVSPVNGQRMVEPGRIVAYTWDVRPSPDFPRRLDVWADGTLWETGHWLNGRLQPSSGIDVAVARGTSAELPLRERLVTGVIRITNLQGWSKHPRIEISQRKPAPLGVKAIRAEVAHG